MIIQNPLSGLSVSVLQAFIQSMMHAPKISLTWLIMVWLIMLEFCMVNGIPMSFRSFYIIC